MSPEIIPPKNSTELINYGAKRLPRELATRERSEKPGNIFKNNFIKDSGNFFSPPTNYFTKYYLNYLYQMYLPILVGMCFGTLQAGCLDL